MKQAYQVAGSMGTLLECDLTEWRQWARGFIVNQKSGVAEHEDIVETLRTQIGPDPHSPRLIQRDATLSQQFRRANAGAPHAGAGRHALAGLERHVPRPNLDRSVVQEDLNLQS